MPSASPGAGALGSSTLVPGVKGGGNPAASFSSSAAAVALQEAAEVSEFVGPVEVELPVEAGAAPSPPSARDSGLLKASVCGMTPALFVIVSLYIYTSLSLSLSLFLSLCV